MLSAVQSTDGMTADWVDLPNEFLQEISNEIINKVKGINRVVYDISSKPPSTIEVNKPSGISISVQNIMKWFFIYLMIFFLDFQKRSK